MMTSPEEHYVKQPQQVAIFGMGGFARLHHSAVAALEVDGALQLIATCDPNSDALPELKADLQNRGVQIYDDFQALLEKHGDELDLVTIATPIPLHAPMHRECVRRGIAVYLEKPPTLDWRELNRMIAEDTNAPVSSQVGFNFIRESERQKLKARLLTGEFGELREACFTGYWPRPVSYFERASWSGKLRSGGNLVLDSCVGNALAHYVHNLLFWCGMGEVLSWGEVDELEAELYRAHSIESFDTAFARGRSKEVTLLLSATHTGSHEAWQIEELRCEHANIFYRTRGGSWEIEWSDGRRESGPTDGLTTAEIVTHNLRHFVNCLNGVESRPLTTLEDSRPFVHLHSLLYVAAGNITTLGSNYFHEVMNARGEVFLEVPEMQSVLHNFHRVGQFPSEAVVPWARRGGHAKASDIECLESTIDHLLLECAGSFKP